MSASRRRNPSLGSATAIWRALVVYADWNRHVVPGHIFRNQRESIWLRCVSTEVGDRNLEDLSQYVDKSPLIEGAHFDEKLANSSTGLLLHGNGLFDLDGRDQMPKHEHVTQAATRTVGFGSMGLGCRPGCHVVVPIDPGG